MFCIYSGSNHLSHECVGLAVEYVSVRVFGEKENKNCQ